jgi:hypothetical protein
VDESIWGPCLKIHRKGGKHVDESDIQGLRRGQSQPAPSSKPIEPLRQGRNTDRKAGISRFRGGIDLQHQKGETHVAKIIIIGDSVEIAQFVEQNLEILQLLREAKTVNAELQAKFDKLNADIAMHVQADQAKDQQIAQLNTDSQAKDQHIADLTNQVATLTAAEAATIQEVGTAVDQADAALNSPHP